MPAALLRLSILTWGRQLLEQSLSRSSFVPVLAGAVTIFYISLFSPLQFHHTWDVLHIFHRYSLLILEKPFPCAPCCSTLSMSRKVLREGKHILAKVLLSRQRCWWHSALPASTLWWNICYGFVGACRPDLWARQKVADCYGAEKPVLAQSHLTLQPCAGNSMEPYTNTTLKCCLTIKFQLNTISAQVRS